MSPVSAGFFVHTFGCQMNMHDSDRIRETLVDAGFTESKNEDEAAIIIFNTCSVREKAEQKLRSEIGKLAPRKLRDPDLVLCVAGCVAQQEGEALLKQIPHCDIIVGPDNILELPMLVTDHRAGGPRAARAVFDVDAPRFLQARFGDTSAEKAPVSAFVTTMKGCDERCSFCIVPHTRGPERYRPTSEILEEIGGYVNAGAREIVLLGQTVDSFRDPALPETGSEDPDETQFPLLLRAIAEAHPKLARLRYTSPHPRHTTPSLVRAHAELDVLAKHVHLPVQSGSDRVLKRMIRRYTSAEYVRRAKALQAARPGLTMSTDIIVGFPGETREDFDATLALVREVNFVSLFAFKYSERPYTPSLKLKDDVTEVEKSERLAELFALSGELTQAHLKTLLGTTQTILVEGRSKNAGRSDANGNPIVRAGVLVQGRTERNEIVHVEVPTNLAVDRELLEVRVTKAYRHSLFGEATERGLRALPMRDPNVPMATNEKRSRRLPIAPVV